MENKNNRTVAQRPPTQSAVGGLGVTRLALSTTAAVFDLGASGLQFFGKRLKVMNEDATIAVWVTFSSDGATAIDMTTAGGATIAAGTVKANGFKLAAGQSIEVRCSKALSRYLHAQAASGTPVLSVYPMSPAIAGQ